MQFRLNRNLTVLIATGMVCVTMLLFTMFIWPTPYMYVVSHGVFRINRFTGNAGELHGKKDNPSEPTFDY